MAYDIVVGMQKLLVVALIIALIFSLYQKRSTSGPSPVVPESKIQTAISKVPATYKVQVGEGLWHVAEKELGDGRKWMEIAQANDIQRPYILTVGQELKIPGKEVEVVTEGVATYTLAQVAQHATKDNCWMALDSKVYDVTAFVASGFHPGKAAILEGCGKDATELFNTRPMGSGTAHSERARKMLPKYYIGELTP